MSPDKSRDPWRSSLSQVRNTEFSDGQKVKIVLQNVWPMLYKSVKDKKDRQNLWNCSRQEDTKSKWHTFSWMGSQNIKEGKTYLLKMVNFEWGLWIRWWCSRVDFWLQGLLSHTYIRLIMLAKRPLYIYFNITWTLFVLLFNIYLKTTALI